MSLMVESYYNFEVKFKSSILSKEEKLLLTGQVRDVEHGSSSYLSNTIKIQFEQNTIGINEPNPFESLIPGRLTLIITLFLLI